MLSDGLITLFDANQFFNVVQVSIICHSDSYAPTFCIWFGVLKFRLNIIVDVTADYLVIGLCPEYECYLEESAARQQVDQHALFVADAVTPSILFAS